MDKIDHSFLNATNNDAKFSSDIAKTYRYALRRCWNPALPSVMFIGLNPSTADETNDDPTLRRCIYFAEKWGYGQLYMTNLFAFRATNPNDMMAAEDPIGPENNNRIVYPQRPV